MIRVFISSKQAELAEDRLIVANTINALGNMQAVMAEEWVPQRQTVHGVYEADVLRCPVYVGLFWKVYSAPTVREYEAALSNRYTEVLLYVRDCPDEQRDEPLRSLIERFKDAHVPARYRMAAELMTVLPTHLHAAVDRMMERLMALGQTARSSGSGPRALRARRDQHMLLEAWDIPGSPEAVLELIKAANRPSP